MNKHRTLPMVLALLAASSLLPAQVDETKPGEQVERHLSPDQRFQQWPPSPDQPEGGDRVETRQVTGEKLETVKLKNVVPPIRFASGKAQIPPDYVEKLARILESMRYRRNVRVHCCGDADS